MLLMLPLWELHCKISRLISPLCDGIRTLTSNTRRGNELPRAYVVLQDQYKDKLRPIDIQNWTASRVSKHKRLEGGVVFISEVPKLASGKIQRKVMREWARRDAIDLEKTTEAKPMSKL